MLEIGAETLLLKSRPDGVLVHSVGLGGKDGEFVGIRCEFLLESGDRGTVDEEEDLQTYMLASAQLLRWRDWVVCIRRERWRGTHSSVCALEHAQLLLSGNILRSRQDTLKNLLRHLPQLGMFLFQ